MGFKNRFTSPGDGFTLLELVVVIAIMGFVFSFSLQYFNGWLDRVRLDGEAERIAAFIVYARNRAITEQIRCGVWFNLEDGSYHLVKLPPDWSDSSFDELILKTESTLDGIILAAENFSSFSGIAAFTPDGIPASSGTLVINNRRGDTVSIIVVSVTGEIRLGN